MILALTGIGVNAGIAIGQVHRLVPGELEIPEYQLEHVEVEEEIRRFKHAVRGVERYLDQVERRLDTAVGQSAREFLEAHRMMLRDEMLLEAACRRIREKLINAEWALSQQHEFLLTEFDEIEDEYLAARCEDIDQVSHLIQRELAQKPVPTLSEHIAHRLDKTIVVAGNLAPADLIVLHQRGVAGLVTEHGSPWAHAAIVAGNLEIPTVVGAHRACRLLREEETVIIDGHYGVVLTGGDEALLRHYRDKRGSSLRHREELVRYRDRPDRTRDAVGFDLQANAQAPEEIRRARELGARGVGLMRTEFLFNNPELPDEDTQYRHYRDAVEAMDGRPVTIRTLDAGGDKLPPGLAMVLSPNPALGLRGLRLTLNFSYVFRQQLRAILRASAHGPVRLLLPMVTSRAEIVRARQLLSACREQLADDDVPMDPDLQVGGMIEVPAAAMAIDSLLPELDFVSIGTNDLIQYLLAIDRQDELVSHLYDPTHPAVLSCLADILRRARESGRPVTVCGELAGDEVYTRLLLGLGVTSFSMPPGKLLSVKKALLESDAKRCREIVERFLEDGAGFETTSLMEALNAG